MNIAIALIFYYLFGLEMQLYSLAGITVSLNLVIDSTIVMADHILHRRNLKAFMSVLAATLTTMGALVIIFFLDDVVDRIFAFEGNGKLTQYEGGYTDYVEAKARRFGGDGSSAGAADKSGSGADGNGEEPKKATKKDWKQGQNRQEKLKFSYKEEREYATIDDDIAKLEEKIAKLENDMMANATNSVKLREIMADKEAAEQQLEEKMDRWVYLNDLAEKIEAQKNNG